jgi:uncharacterized protein
MQVPLQPLTDAEESLLQQLLDQSHSPSLWYARGVFTAIACEPSLQDVTQWLQFVLGADVVDQATLRELMGLLLRDRFVVEQCLELGEPLLPDSAPSGSAPSHGLVQFCKGFVRLSQASEPWPKDAEASALVLPLAVTAGYLKIESLRAVLPEIGDDAVLWQQTQESELQSRLLTLYTHFAPLRAKRATVQNAGKVGRNEPCPCGSGRKFKKCCGAA